MQRFGAIGGAGRRDSFVSEYLTDCLAQIIVIFDDEDDSHGAILSDERASPQCTARVGRVAAEQILPAHLCPTGTRVRETWTLFGHVVES